MIYFDTSVVVPCYFPEALSKKAQAMIQDSPHSPVISHLTEVEFISAVVKKIRLNELLLEEVHQIVNKFHIHLDSQIFKRIPLETSHFHFASDYIRQFKVPLKTLDALHLAIVAKEKLILATADAELERAARFFGIKVQIIS